MATNTKKSMRNTLFAGHVSILAMLGIFGGWAAMTDINGAVIAHATIVAESYSKRIQHREGGIVSKILVKDGDLVTEGQPLIVLDPTDVKAELGIVEGSLDELLIKKARLESERDGTGKIILPVELDARKDSKRISDILLGQQKLMQSTADSTEGKLSQLKQQVAQLNEQISGIEAQLKAKKAQAEFVAKELANLKKLQAKGLVPNNRVLSVEGEKARLEGEDGELRASKAAALNRIGEVELRALQMKEDLRTQALTELRDVETKISEFQERRVALSSRMARTTITSPITGTVYQSALHTEGGVAAPGETLMSIVPEGDDLVLQAQVSPNDIDQIHIGQAAQVKFPSFNSRTTPEIWAEVQQVAADVARVDASTPPFYAVRIIISAKELKRLGDNKLKPGMNAEAFIQTGARSPMSYLVKPLVDQITHAFREG
jgi:HlyD family secretion protein